MSGRMAFVVRDVEKRYGSTTVLEDANVTIHDGVKVGVIGRNGAGKSTLCRLLLLQEEPDRGTITRADGLRVGFLAQHDPFTLDETAGAFLERHTGREGWRCGQTAARLGLTPADLARTMGELPGGYRTRVKLTAMLLEDPDFLVLDEPTNFLDLATVLLLQDFLADFRGGALVVSHDREFLKGVCDHTLLVERNRTLLYPGDVEEFFSWQTEQMEVARRTNAAIEARREHLQAFVDRFKAKASKAAQAQSKLKEIGRLRPVEIANPLATVRIRIPPCETRKGMAFSGEELAIGYGGRAVAKGVNVAVDRGEKIAIVGDNGQGKTTLLRTLAGDLAPVAGQVRRAHGIEIGYYAQHVYQAIPGEETVRSHLERSASNAVTRQEILDLAGAFLFQGPDVEKPVSVLSGGERARLCLAGLLLGRKNVLVLDEPTNHLDFETVEALGAALRAFDGTVLCVSHDRTFVNMIATRILEVGDGRVRVVTGSYADYVEDLQKRGRSQTAAARRPAGAAAAATPEDHAERRRRKNERDRVEKALRKLEESLERLQSERKSIHAELERSASGWDASLQGRLHGVEKGIEEAEAEWLVLTEKLESLR